MVNVSFYSGSFFSLHENVFSDHFCLLPFRVIKLPEFSPWPTDYRPSSPEEKKKKENRKDHLQNVSYIWIQRKTSYTNIILTFVDLLLPLECTSHLVDLPPRPCGLTCYTRVGSGVQIPVETRPTSAINAPLHLKTEKGIVKSGTKKKGRLRYIHHP